MLMPNGPLNGDIIAPNEGVRVFVRPSPFTRGRVEITAPAGETVFDIVHVFARAALAGHPTEGVIASVNGDVIPREMWAGVRVKSGATVALLATPLKGWALNKVVRVVVAVVSVVIAIAVPFVAPIIAGALGVSAGVGLAIAGGLGVAATIGANLALNALFPTPRTSQQALSSSGATVSSLGTATTASEVVSPTYSIGGGSNSQKQFGFIPQILGKHRISPPYAAAPYGEIVGDDQYLRLLFVVGYGPLTLSDIKIGETLVSQFEGVTMQVVTNHLTDSQTLYTQPVYEEQLSISLAPAGTWSQRTTADQVDEFSVDFGFPSGVYRFQRSDGTYQAYTVRVDVQYRLKGATTWIGAPSITVTSSSQQTFRRSVVVTGLARGQYEVRVQKGTSDYSGVDTVVEAISWTALRGRRNTAVINYPKPLTLVALRIKASAELSGSVSTFNCIAQPQMRCWNGSSWVAGQLSQNPADIFRHVLQGDANARPVPDSALDLAAIQNWWSYCNTQGFKFSHVRDFGATVWQTLQDVASAGRAAVIFNDGKWSVVWDAENAPIVQHFTPRNSSNFEFLQSYKDLPHAFRVTFVNEKNNYLNDERIVYDDGYTAANATKFEGIDFAGITDPDLIWRFGRYHIAQNRLRPSTYKLDVDIEGLICTRGDRVRVNHYVTKWGVGSARVKSVLTSPDRIVIDDTMTMEAGKSYQARVRLNDGTALVRSVVTTAGETTTLTLSGSGSLPSPGDLVMFGEVGFESVVLRVKEIRSKSDFSAQLIMFDDAPEIANADKGTIPAFVTGIAPTVDLRAVKPRDLVIRDTLEPLSAKSTLSLSWVPPLEGVADSYVVQLIQGTQTTTQNVTAPSAQFAGVDDGTYTVRVRAAFRGGALSDWVTQTYTLFSVANGTPPDVAGFQIAVVNGTALLQWTDAPSPLVQNYQIRFSPAISGATWSTSPTLVESVSGSSVQVPAMVGTYLIKAVSFKAIASANAALIVNTVADNSNVLQTLTQEPAFSGAQSNVFASGGALRLIAPEDLFGWDDFFGPTDFFLGFDGLSLTGEYAFASGLDLGAVYTSRLSANVEAGGETVSSDFFSLGEVFGPGDFFGALPSLWDVTVYARTTQTDPAGSPTWTAWAPLVVGNYTARAFEFKAVLTSGQADITPVVSQLAVTVDMPDRIVAASDLAVPSSGLSVSFSPPFRSLQGVGIAAQGLETGDYYEITGKNDNGFNISFKNAAGAGVERTFDYVAKGYGVRQ